MALTRFETFCDRSRGESTLSAPHELSFQMGRNQSGLVSLRYCRGGSIVRTGDSRQKFVHEGGSRSQSGTVALTHCFRFWAHLPAESCHFFCLGGNEDTAPYAKTARAGGMSVSYWSKPENCGFQPYLAEVWAPGAQELNGFHARPPQSGPTAGFRYSHSGKHTRTRISPVGDWKLSCVWKRIGEEVEREKISEFGRVIHL
jgi:hypothetical protein